MVWQLLKNAALSNRFPFIAVFREAQLEALPAKILNPNVPPWHKYGVPREIRNKSCTLPFTDH